MEKVGGRARGTGRGKNCLCTKVTQGHETIRFAVFLVWGFLFVWLVCFFRRQPILSFCSSVLCLFHCPTARYCCYTNKRCEINVFILFYGFIKWYLKFWLEQPKLSIIKIVLYQIYCMKNSASTLQKKSLIYGVFLLLSFCWGAAVFLFLGGKNINKSDMNKAWDLLCFSCFVYVWVSLLLHIVHHSMCTNINTWKGGEKPSRKTQCIKSRADDLNSQCQTAEDGSLNTTNQYWNQGKQKEHPKERLRTAQEARETRPVLAVNSRTAFSFLHPRNNLRSTQQSGLPDKHRLVASNSLQHWCLNNPHKDQSVVTVAINCFQPTHNRHIFLLLEVG